MPKYSQVRIGLNLSTVYHRLSIQIVAIKSGDNRVIPSRIEYNKTAPTNSVKAVQFDYVVVRNGVVKVVSLHNNIRILFLYLPLAPHFSKRVTRHDDMLRSVTQSVVVLLPEHSSRRCQLPIGH